MVAELEMARGGEAKLVGSGIEEDLRIMRFLTGDVASELARGVHQVPVVLELHYGLLQSHNVHLTDGHDQLASVELGFNLSNIEQVMETGGIDKIL
jgi:hypothetical protein